MEDTRLIQVLGEVCVRPERPWSLEILAEEAGLSPGHFHRTFTSRIGETPARYLERIRLERAAYLLRAHEDAVIEVALDVGYRHHETFTRAFRRRYGCSPREFRRRAGPLSGSCRGADSENLAYQLSPTRLRRRATWTVAFLRHVGPYDQVPVDLWTRLAQMLRNAKVPDLGLRIGVGHDSPSTTDSGGLRFDAGIVVPEDVTSIAATCGVYTLEGALCAMVTHQGPYATLPYAYAETFRGGLQKDTYEISGLPAVEVYHHMEPDPALSLNYTDVYLPVRRTRTGSR